LGLVSLADAAYLTLVHVDLVTGAGGIGRICHALSKTGCEVTGGRFGDVLGVPVAVIGGGGALAILVTAVVALVRRRDDAHPSHALLVGLAAVALLVSLLMATLSLVESAYCPFCVFWYLLNIATFAAAVAAADRSIAASLRASVGGLRRPVGVLAILVFAAGVGLGMTAYLRVLTRITDVVAVTVREEIDAALARPQITDLDLKDQPRRRVGGPGEAIEIVEFSDFECPYCRQLWVHAERYFAETDRPLEVVFVNYPLDASCNANTDGALHPQACFAAYAGECAQAQGRFWEYAERLFHNQPDLGRADLIQAAADLGLDMPSFERCLDDPATAAAIVTDVNLGTKSRIRGTPMVLIDGYKLAGVVRAPFFEGMLSRIQGPAPSP
jgi:protein-disulfide isomerase